MARRVLQAHFIDTATGSAHIQALGWVLKNIWQSRRYLDRYRQTSIRVESLQRWLLSVSDLLVVSLLTLGMVASLFSEVEPYRLGLYLFTVLTVGDCVNFFMESLKGLRNQLCILKEMEDFIETTPREVQANQLLKEKPEEEERKEEEREGEEREDLGDIKFTEASISYGQKGVNVLENITMTIPKGSHFGVFGEAQSGKSALLLALCGLLPYTGSITLNEREIRDIPRSRLLEIFAILPETPVVFPGATILQTLFPSEILDPGKSERHQGAMSLLLFRLGLKAMIDEIGGLEAKFEDLYLTSDQMHLFSLARLIGQHLYGRGSIFLIDGVTGKVGLETHTRMRLAIRDFLPQGETTLIYTFGYNQLVLHSTHLSQIVEKNIIPVPLGVPEVAA